MILIRQLKEVFQSPEAKATRLLQNHNIKSNFSLSEDFTQACVCRQEPEKYSGDGKLRLKHRAVKRFWVKIYEKMLFPLPRWLKRKFLIQEAAADEMSTPGTGCSVEVPGVTDQRMLRF